MINPYTAFVAGYVAALLLYLLRWSDLYPRISNGLLFFLLAVITLFSGVSFWMNKKRLIRFTPVSMVGRYAAQISFFIYLLWILEFIHAGGVPLLKVILNQPYDYTLFGIPTLHVFVVTFSSFFTIYLFHAYISTKDRTLFGWFLINLLSAILIYNRAMLFFNLTAAVFIFLVERKKITIRQVTTFTVVVLILFYLFGVMGSLRQSRIAKREYTNDNFLRLGQATDAFRRSPVPKEFFWSYFYISSPLANLQLNINETPPPSISIKNITGWINNELLMDFISKRINAFTNEQRRSDHRIHETFNASSIFSVTYSYLGFTGLFAMTTVLLILPLLLVKILPSTSPFFLSAMAILSTMFVFSMFDNTIRFTGLSFQLVYPVLFHFLAKRLPVLNNFFVNKKVTSTQIE